MTAPVIAPVEFKAPPVNPAPFGLFAATDWQPEDENRWFNGVHIRNTNFGGEDASGVWQPAYYCSAPVVGQKKEGERPDDLPHFDPITVWAYDECDPLAPTRREIEERAAQILRIEEQTAIELEVSNRLLVDAGTPEPVATFKEAVGYIEGVLAKTNVVGFIHAGAQWASQEFGLVIKSGTRWVSPLGHTWVFGGGYVDGLDRTIVATSQPFGWRDEATTRTVLDAKTNTFAAVAERTVVIGYEAVIAAATIAP